MARQEQARDSVSIAITGSGGGGAITAGGILMEAAARAGWYGLLTRSVGPQIRGGEAAALVCLSTTPVACGAERYDVLVALDWLNIDRFAAEIPLSEDSLVIADPEAGEIPPTIADSGARIAELAIKETADGIPGGRPNMLALGIAAGLIGLPESALFATLEKTLGKKGPEAVSASSETVRAGMAAAATLGASVTLSPPSGAGDGRWIISGNEAAALGAVRGGVRFAAAYPITPATEVLEWLAPALAKLGGSLVQAEDELASINMVIGASYGGTPSITATSGPGLALMTESIGLATASEVPIVVVDVMRGGPSTGIPTKSEQSDLNIAVYGLHGDAPHIVVAPNSVSDCLFTTQWAVHLAEAMQAPAIVLSDQFLGQARAAIDRPADVAFIARREVAADPAEAYQRYAVTASGVSPMAIPGTAGGQYTADGLEHNPRGTPSTRAEDHATQMDKRRDKIAQFDYGDHWAEIEGDGPLAIITWGSTTGPVRDALARAAADGFRTRLIAPRLLAPAQPERFAKAMEGVERALVVEQTHSGQFHHYLRAHYDLPAETRTLHRPGPLMIRPGDVHAALLEWRGP
ncbi:MAG: 2-oxoacid:acceptor oxidoreductase subunit alpha [Alphaproteobacteria bacterium]|nr:2-oxoacid:acceptor oxidoreductase subunit alpha [Alphaproteobacteria bacterium]